MHMDKQRRTHTHTLPCFPASQIWNKWYGIWKHSYTGPTRSNLTAGRVHSCERHRKKWPRASWHQTGFVFAAVFTTLKTDNESQTHTEGNEITSHICRHDSEIPTTEQPDPYGSMYPTWHQQGSLNRTRRDDWLYSSTRNYPADRGKSHARAPGRRGKINAKYLKSFQNYTLGWRRTFSAWSYLKLCIIWSLVENKQII